MSGIFLLMFFACVFLPVAVGLWAAMWMLLDGAPRPTVRKTYL